MPAPSRGKAIGVVVFYGVVISVVLTLGVVPAVYTLVARNTGSPEAAAQRSSGCARTGRHAPAEAARDLPPDTLSY